MAKKKKGGGDAPAGSPAWMATFSDLMNLLLCFFVLLFSMSSVDAAKFEQVVASLQSSFSVLPAGGTTIGEGQMLGSGISQLPEYDVYFNTAMSNSGKGEDSDKENDYKNQYEEEGLSESEKMAEDMEEAFEKAGIAEQINVEFNEQYVLLTMNGAILFESGKAEVQADAKPIIMKMAQVVSKYNTCVIEIEGHTDNVPIHSKTFESNDVLSTFRALAVTDYMKSVAKFNPALVKFSGRGSYCPIATNKTAEGRAKNRRVEVKVYNSLYTGTN